MNLTMWVSNILTIYTKASAYELNEGKAFFNGDAWAFCMNQGWRIAATVNPTAMGDEIHSRKYAKMVAAIVAIMSPKKEWRVNKALAAAAVDSLLEGTTVKGHFEPQCLKIHKLWDYYLTMGDDVTTEDVLNIISKPESKKTRHFYLNICGDHSLVTIDGHAVSIANHGLQRVSITNNTSQVKGDEYDRYAEAYIIASKLLGVEPATVQAVTWVTYRRMDLLIVRKPKSAAKGKGKKKVANVD